MQDFLDFESLRRVADLLPMRFQGVALIATISNGQHHALAPGVDVRAAHNLVVEPGQIGLYVWRRPPESDAFNFLPRVSVPTLMINGRHDFYFPFETSQAPMFRLLGAPAAKKRHHVFESGHVPTERQEVMKEILDWLDRYLGPAR